MKKKFAVIGLGRFGRTVATMLARNGAEVFAIDKILDNVEQIKDEVSHAAALDTEDIKALESQEIVDYDVVVVAIGSDFEAMLLTTVNLMNLDVKRIIARAMNKTQRSILRKLGLEEKDIISPEIQVGETLADDLIHPDIHRFLKLPDEYELVQVTAPPKITNHTILELDLRKQYAISIIAIEREVSSTTDEDNPVIDRKVLGITDPESMILENDNLILIGQQANIQKFIDLNS